jgi:sterol desaturase/sphingolipid hydroxylase (fatty acid hydroxylase superfamily)
MSTPSSTRRSTTWTERGLRWCYAIFAIAFPLTVVVDACLHETITLGPGLVEESGSMSERLQILLEGRSTLFLGAFCVLGLFVLLWNGVMTYRGLSFDDHEALTPREIATFFLCNAVLAGLLYLALGLLGVGASALGYGFFTGFDAIARMTVWCTAQVAKVPVLWHLPYPLPLLAGILLVDLFEYWFHRLGHIWRPFWLLWHRPHHMTPYLTIPTTQPVFAAFPLFIVLSVPFQLGVGVAAKLFYSETMIGEALFVRLIGQIVAIGSHNSALYSLFWKNRVLRALGAAYGEGPYHYIHHISSAPDCNFGAMPFMFWDRVFGTYRAPTAERPSVGLWGRPALHWNPVRLALSGVLQVIYELRMNAGLLTRLRILFGSLHYMPPQSRDYSVLGTSREVADELRDQRDRRVVGNN